MIVGEPSLMGGEMDDEDERFITRLENNPSETSLSNPSFATHHPMKREQISPKAPPSLLTS